MPRSTAGFKDEASANEVERWLNRQESLGKPVTAHRDLLATAGATVRGVVRDDAKAAAPVVAAPHVSFAPSPSERTPARPSSGSGTRATASGASPRRSPTAAVSVPGSRASASTCAHEAGRAKTGVDPTTNAPPRLTAAFCGGFAGARSANAEGFDAPHDPAARALLRPAFAAARAAKAESQTRSRYAESLSCGDGSASASELRAWWRANALQTTKRAFDAPVAAAAAEVPGAAADLESRRRGFADAARGTRLYYGDLFSDEGAAAVDARLRDAEPEEAVQIIEAMRAVHAGTATHRRRTRTTTATDFRQGFVPTEADARRRAETARRARRARAPPEAPAAVEARVKRKADLLRSEASDRAAAKARGDAASAATGRRTVGVNCDPARAAGGGGERTAGAKRRAESFGNDFESAVVPRFRSSYAEKQCAHMPEIVAQTRAGGHRVKHEEKATMPFGEGAGLPRRLEGEDGAGRVIGIWRNRPGTGGDSGNRALYPIPRYLTRRRPESARGKHDASSTSRRAFAPRSAEFGEKRAAEVRATVAANKTKRSESRVPLGNKGITDHPRHRMTSSYVSDYVETHARRVESAEGEKENESA